MFDILQVVTVLLVAVAMALTLAHALELPGKMRHTKDVYYAMQHIYYPGFTIGGFAEPASLYFNDYPVVFYAVGERRFFADACSTTGTHRYAGNLLPVYASGEQVLASGAKLSGLGSGFFSLGANRSPPQKKSHAVNWTDLRNRWEYSHIARAGLAFASLTTLVIAITNCH